MIYVCVVQYNIFIVNTYCARDEEDREINTFVRREHDYAVIEFHRIALTNVWEFGTSMCRQPIIIRSTRESLVSRIDWNARSLTTTY